MSGKMNWLWTLLVPLIVFPAFAEIIELPEAPAPAEKQDTRSIDYARKWAETVVLSEEGVTPEFRSADEMMPIRPKALRDMPRRPQVNELDELVWTESFEGTFPGDWTRFNSNGWDPETYRFSLGSQALWCAGGSYDPEVDNYPDDFVTYVVYGPIDMSGYDEGLLVWDQWIDVEVTYDHFFAGVSADGDVFQGFGFDGHNMAWETEAMNIDDYCGGDLYILFKFQSDYTINYEGAWVDWIDVNGYTNPPPPTVSELYVTDITHSPMNPSVGATVTTTVEIMNDGPDPAESFWIDLYTNQFFPPTYDGPTGNEATVVGTLNPGATYSHDFTYTYTGQGVKHVWALIDWDEIINEPNEDNNVGGVHDLPVGAATVIDVEPAGSITVPAGGGNVNYNIFATSYTSTVQRDGWITVTYLPTGNGIETLSVTVWFNPANPMSLNRNQFVPGMAPAGPYSLTVSVGNNPWMVHDSGTLFFSKAGSTVNGVNDLGDADQWISSGDSFRNAEEKSVTATDGLPTEFKLTAPTPNPFNPTAQFSVQLPSNADLRVDVYDINGRLVSQLVRGTHSAGSHTFTLDGSALSSGVYFVRAATDAGEAMVRKAILMK